MRAKIIDGVFTPAPRKIEREIDGVEYITYNPTDEMLAEAGWLPITETEPAGVAPVGYHYEPYYTDLGDEIMQGWVLVETEYSDADAYEILFGGDVE